MRHKSVHIIEKGEEMKCAQLKKKVLMCDKNAQTVAQRDLLQSFRVLVPHSAFVR